MKALFIVTTLLVFGGCEKKSEQPPDTIIGEWTATKEYYEAKYSDGRPTVINVIANKDDYSIIKAIIGKDKIEFMQSEGLIGKGTYTFGQTGSDKYLNAVFYGAKYLYVYKLEGNFLSLTTYSQGQQVIGRNVTEFQRTSR